MTSRIIEAVPMALRERSMPICSMASVVWRRPAVSMNRNR